MRQPGFVSSDAGALAIGAGNGNHPSGNFVEPEPFAHLADSIQPQLDGFIVQNHLPFQPLIEGIKTHRENQGLV